VIGVNGDCLDFSYLFLSICYFIAGTRYTARRRIFNSSSELEEVL
jgi:hypothetical protein